MRIELINVEYGDCTVFVGEKTHVLMVDCGSANNKLRSPAMDITSVFDYIKNRYSRCSSRAFLLTHYHRDHICGFKKIYREDRGYFGKIYLPYIPKAADGSSPILEFALACYLFLSPLTNCAQVNLSCLSIFDFLGDSLDKIKVLSAEKDFFLENTHFMVLSPQMENFQFDEKFLDYVNQLKQLCEDDSFTNSKNKFMDAYYNCLRLFSDNYPLELKSAAVEKLKFALEQLENYKGRFSVGEITENMTARELYSKAVNDISVVFHNVRLGKDEMDILMPGDVSESILPMIENKLYESYNIVKAPHHGTDSCYWKAFKTMGVNHILISNGDYQSGGNISEAYLTGEFINHCTNTSACGYFAENKDCCNRLKFCYSAEQLALKCTVARTTGRLGQCGIYVLAPANGRSCFC